MYGILGAMEPARAAFDKICNHDVYSWNMLLTSYAQNESLKTARTVFDKMPEKNVVSWNAMMSAYAAQDCGDDALDLFFQMQATGIMPNKVTFICAVDACAHMGFLEKGLEIHAAIVGNGYEADVVVGTSLINMYGKGSKLSRATRVFYRMPQKNVVSWTAMIAACEHTGHSQEALDLFLIMQINDIVPNQVTFTCVLCACANLATSHMGQRIHGAMLSSGYELDTVLCSALINMYGKCGSLDDARVVFAKTQHKDTVAWNTMISASTQNGHSKEALDLFYQMQLETVKPNIISFICALEACGSLPDLREGHKTHSLLVGIGLEQDVTTATALLDMYGKCQSVNDALGAFSGIQWQDTAPWNAMIKVFAENRCDREAHELFRKMHTYSIMPDKITFISALEACNSLETSNLGLQMHAEIIDNSYEGDVVMANALLNMYCKFKNYEDVKRMFNRMISRDVVSWNALISLCAQNGHGKEAIEHIYCMQFEGIEPDSVSFLCALAACSNSTSLQKGQELHAASIASGFRQDPMVSNALVSMYGNCGSLLESRIVFEAMPHPDVVSWSSIIAAFSQNDHGQEALLLFHHMELTSIKPDKVILICALNACANIAALEEGEKIHAGIAIRGYKQDGVVGTALVDMYGKCGSLPEAKCIFLRMSQRDLVCWNALITACAQNGHGNEALELFGQMELEGVKPNSITFISVLTACSHTGRVEDGTQYFYCMYTDHGVPQLMEHYVCMIDMFGRAGHLDEAEDLLNSMPFELNLTARASLLSACKIHGDVERALNVVNVGFVSVRDYATSHVILSNIYAAPGRKDEVEDVPSISCPNNSTIHFEQSHMEMNKHMHSFAHNMWPLHPIHENAELAACN